MSGTTSPTLESFATLNLNPALLKAIQDIGYETPTPIQAESIPPLLAKKDLLGQAQTGTGKTGAFALPILAGIELNNRVPQALVLTPTRELAIQVAEAFQSYARYLKNFHVLPIYGGQDYGTQLRQLKRGPHVIVGTPGRVMDHLRRGSLTLNTITTLVLDEADEMLRMGFIDDVEWILEQTPENRQIALFSATVPPDIRRIAHNHLHDPLEITIKQTTGSANTINQRHCLVSNQNKLEALTRILEAEETEGIIIFVRTKTATVELAEKLSARGYAATAINGDMAQNLRERTVAQFKSGKLDILIATDVAARGLDVDRVSHVINYDVPYDTESYVHRIGRTGRAGRKGEAILFVTHREKRMLAAIEKTCNQRIPAMDLPSSDLINIRRIASFKQNISQTLATEDLTFFAGLIEEYQQEHEVDALQIAAALAKQLQGDQPLLVGPVRESQHQLENRKERSAGPPLRERREKPEHKDSKARADRDRSRAGPDVPMESFRIEVGHAHGVKPGNIVGAIANEADIDSAYIGHIKIFDDHSLVDLPEGMPAETFAALQKVWVSGQAMRISRLAKAPGQGGKKFAGNKLGDKKTGEGKRRSRSPETSRQRTE
ncbi:MAG: DEAD/DEAH box helicase [Pseudomonadales bacterium]|nr:DEAD/DEAH box helicase [Pseudomonadales bacterium]